MEITKEDCTWTQRFDFIEIEFNPMEGPLIYVMVDFLEYHHRDGEREFMNFQITYSIAYDDNGKDVEITENEYEQFIELAKILVE